MVLKVDEDELIEHWTLVGDELGQVAGRRGATRLGFALLLKFYPDMAGSRAAAASCRMRRWPMSLARWAFRPLMT
jgi:hypothetical protein